MFTATPTIKQFPVENKYRPFLHDSKLVLVCSATATSTYFPLLAVQTYVPITLPLNSEETQCEWSLVWNTRGTEETWQFAVGGQIHSDDGIGCKEERLNLQTMSCPRRQISLANDLIHLEQLSTVWPPEQQSWKFPEDKATYWSARQHFTLCVVAPTNIPPF